MGFVILKKFYLLNFLAPFNYKMCGNSCVQKGVYAKLLFGAQLLSPKGWAEIVILLLKNQIFLVKKSWGNKKMKSSEKKFIL